ncbi:DUF4406 domain-containing protein [Alicyclobacillus macrosporangiidus]|uniref:DUF4406 domain-containing protein n=1 Tax=Alicyclobacillus macrosporangiidus TaxID=392015 RepID=UPI000944EE1D
MRVYLCGPMSGLPNLNREQFLAAANDLRDLGLDVYNPAEQRAPEDPWALYMRQNIRELMSCQAVALLPGWEFSRGARIKTFLATTVDIPLYTWKDIRGLPLDADRIGRVGDAR